MDTAAAHRPSRVELGLGALSVALGAASLLVGDTLLDALGIAATSRPSYATAFSVFFLLVGFLLIQYSQQVRATAYVSEQVEQVAARLQARIPIVQGVEVVTTDDAFEALAIHLRSATHIWNTRIAPPEAVVSYDTPASKRYERALRQALNQGASMRDVVSSDWREEAVAVAERIAPTGGTYRWRLVARTDMPPFLNFIVVETRPGVRIGYCGWAVSRDRGYEQPCLQVNDARVIDYLLDLHRELYDFARYGDA